MAPAQKRLTRILLALGMAGSLLIGGLWWDSTRFTTTSNSGQYTIGTRLSLVFFVRLSDPIIAGIPRGVDRNKNDWDSIRVSSLFPRPDWRHQTGSDIYTYILLPYYLILLTYLAALLLLWLLLMNRLASREAVKEIRASNRPE